MKILKIFTVIGVFFIFMVSTTWASCSGTTEEECTAQTWTQNSCRGNTLCDSAGGAVTQDDCSKRSAIGQSKGLGGVCTWSTR